MVLYDIHIIRLRISKFKKVHLAILEAMSGAGRVKSNKTDEQKGLKSIWITGFKQILGQMKFVIVLIFLLDLPLTTIGL